MKTLFLLAALLMAGSATIAYADCDISNPPNVTGCGGTGGLGGPNGARFGN